MGSRRNREELGDSCGFCLRCGWGRRFMTGEAAMVPSTCPDCGGEVITACPACGEPIVSLMGVSCRACGEPLRDPVLFGVEIRRKGERVTVAVDAPPPASDNESTVP
jgi:predicted amidophosphoribosyltransferase